MPGEIITTPHVRVDELTSLGVLAFTTTKAAGTFSLASEAPVGEVMTNWSRLQTDLAPVAAGIVIAPQVHGTTVLSHTGPWQGLLRTTAQADGHATMDRGISLAVTIADCVPVFIAHPSGAIAMLHSGWRGTADKIIHQAIRTLGQAHIPPDELHVHLGPSICGRCYEVSADVRTQLTGQPATRAGCVDLRSIIAEDAKAAGVRQITVSEYCTDCHNDLFFSHRSGDAGRQVAIIARL